MADRIISPPTGRFFRFRSELDYAPDGRRLVFLQSDGIRVLDIATRKVRAIPHRMTGPVSDVVWTPDGRRLAYLHTPRARRRGSPPPTRLYGIKPNGKGKRRLFAFPTAHVRSLAWQAIP